MITLAEITAKIQCPNYDGYFLRWYFNGWHSFYFAAGDEQLTTSGKWHNTESVTKVRIGAAGLSESEIRAIRTMLFANRVEVLLQDGWKNVVIDSTTLKIYNSNVNGFRCEFGITIYAKVADYTPVVPPIIVTENVRITPEGDIRITPENDTRVVNSGDYDPIVSYTPFPNITKFVGENVALPNTASVIYASGKTANLIVTWDYFDNSQAGTFDVYGDVGGGELAVKQRIILTAKDDLYWLRQIRDANPTSQLPALWLDSEDPYTEWEGVTWDSGRVKDLNIPETEIHTIVGVKGLSNLVTLNVDSCEIYSLDVSGMTNMQTLICGNNQMIELNVYGCSSLSFLECISNNLTTLNLQGLSSLLGLNCTYNQISEINISGISLLTLFFCDQNKLTAIPTLTSKQNIVDFYDFRRNYMPTSELNRLRALGFNNDSKLLPQYSQINQ